MANIIDMPKLSDTMTVGTLVKWLKGEGDAVRNGDILAEVETDKATMELECFFDGTLLRIFIPAGSQVPVGSALCAVGKPGETVEAPAPQPSPRRVEAVQAKPTGSPAPSAPRPSSPGALPPPPPLPPPAPGPQGSSARLRVSPLARVLAAEKGIDLSRLTGSGPGGRIVRDDVLAAAKAPPASPTPQSPARADALPAPPKPGEGGSSPAASADAVPVSTIRALIARRLLESKTRIPHFYLDIEVDAEPMLTLRGQLNAAYEKEGVKLSVNDFILKAAAEALSRVPAVNRSWEEPQGGQPAIRQHGAAHVSFAVAIEDGLITPVIRDAQAKSVLAISREAKSLAALAKEKRLQPAQYTGGTFCVSNLGMFGIERFSAIINPPNAAILAVGATVRKPVVKGDQIAIGQRMILTLSCDHRVVDGATGAAFLATLRDLLEKPVMFLV
jgi:pyruvate dehydrogenase E2 component (dihydrolipoamide acetyltransferase)